MNLKKAQTGDPLIIPAPTYNAFVDAAISHRRGRDKPRDGSRAQQQSTGVVLVQNKSGVALERYACVQIDKPIILPAASEPEFQERIALEVIKATAAQTCWAILQEPLEADGIGVAVIDGITIARINLQAASHTTVNSDPAGVIPLSTEGGPGQIVWVLGGVGTATATGEQWAILRLVGNGATLPIGQYPGQFWGTVADNQATYVYPFAVQTV